ncbi:MAG: septal ring lytic transglycosylase RlpA family protein [Zoogloeaceae bacterium]|jgi:rare lipoprotein A (peptidoglycan hydrolase)|nr:septal ring lytic transglycosylase RlpA family protein [Zoogloeaceae bacterium]
MKRKPAWCKAARAFAVTLLAAGLFACAALEPAEGPDKSQAARPEADTLNVASAPQNGQENAPESASEPAPKNASLRLPENLPDQTGEPALKLAPRMVGAVLLGKASYYGKTDKFQGRRTANGERFDARVFTAASNRFPLGSWIAVRRRGMTHCVVVWVNDRMHPRHKVRIVDLSYAAAQALGMIRVGVADVEARQLRGAPGIEPAICLQAFLPELAEPLAEPEAPPAFSEP